MRHVTSRQDDDKPLSEPVFLILVSLAAGPRHGYALLSDVAGLSGGRVRLSTGTLYGAIRRMLEDGWIEPHAQDDTAREKQAYKLTAEGSRRVEAEVERMKQLTRAAAARLRRREAWN